jgi:hypothetical protein
MNRFRKLGFIKYDVGDNLHVHSTLLNVVLHDDDGINVNSEINTSTEHSNKVLEPPSEPGGPPDRERARRPLLPAVQRGK